MGIMFLLHWLISESLYVVDFRYVNYKGVPGTGLEGDTSNMSDLVDGPANGEYDGSVQLSPGKHRFRIILSIDEVISWRRQYGVQPV